MRLQANDDYNRKIKWNVALQLQQLLSPSSPSREHPCILPLFKIYIYDIYMLVRVRRRRRDSSEIANEAQPAMSRRQLTQWVAIVLVQ